MLRDHIRFLTLALALLLSLSATRILPDIFQPLDYTMNDWRTRFALQVLGWVKGPPEQERRVIIIDIDERSLAEQGAWPWPRDKLAKLLQILLDDYRVAGAALDIVFPEAREQDQQLAAQLRRAQVTGAVVYDLQQRQLPESRAKLPELPPLHFAAGAPRISGVPVTSNHAGIMPARVGHITPLFDSDGSIRQLPPVVCHQTIPDICRPVLGIAAFTGLLAEPQLQMQRGQGWLSPAWVLSITEGNDVMIARVPLNRNGTLTVPYRHRQKDWTALSATDVLRHKVNPSLLNGSLVLVGATALGMSDVVSTPISPVAAGLEPHAEVILALLDNNFLLAPQYGLWLDAFLLLPFALLLNWALRRFVGPAQRAAIFPFWLGLCWLSGITCAMGVYLAADLLLPLTPLTLFPLFAILLTISAELYFTSRERVGVLGLLAAYLPKQVADKLTAAGTLADKVDTSVDASRREITVMFADVRGFTGVAENHKPEVVAKLMHRVFSEMAEAVVAHNGTIDKFIGDAVMAFWNAPDDDPLHAMHALAAAQDMLRRIHGLAVFCRELGVAPVSIGMGIETGYALVGNFGSEHRRTYTALGETVVLASRIEGLTSQYQQAILIGESCARALGGEGLQSLGATEIRGRQQALALFAPIHAPARR